MKYMKVLLQIVLLWGFSLLGSTLSSLANIGIPGNIIGLAILLLFMQCKLIKLKWIETGANFLLAELLLFFIPSAVGIVEYKDLFTNYNLLCLLFTIAISTVTVLVFVIFAAKIANLYQDKEHDIC